MNDRYERLKQLNIIIVKEPENNKQAEIELKKLDDKNLKNNDFIDAWIDLHIKDKQYE